MKTRVFLGAIFLMSSPVAIQALPAFYGAEGGGSLAVGGRGGTVCAVTSLADSGSGTLRACINTHNNTSGSRMTVVFRVGGTINLQSSLRINRSNITIAGQTAPGGGILLRDNIPSTSNTLIGVHANDVIVRFIRFRGGYRETGSVDTLAVTGVSRVIIDSSSFSWGTYRIMRMTNLNDFTFSRNIVSEAILAQRSSAAMLIGFLGSGQSNLSNSIRLDFHHNLIMSNAQRKTAWQIKESSFINNITYNWRGGWGFALGIGGGVTTDVIGNIWKRGPGPAGGPGSEDTGVKFWPSCDANTNSNVQCANNVCLPGNPSIYIEGNRFGGETGLASDNWSYIRGSANPAATCSPTGSSPFTLPLSWRRHTPLSSINPRTHPITVHHVINDNLEQIVLNDVGASKRLDCLGNWVSNRDAVDQRLVSQYVNNTGVIPTHENDVGGFPTIAGGTPCQDTDGDGMPDQWEIAMGLNPNDPSDRNQIHSSGYTMLEMYLNGPMTTTTTITVPENIRFIEQL